MNSYYKMNSDGRATHRKEEAEFYKRLEDSDPLVDYFCMVSLN